MATTTDKPILFFDGECNLCNSLVRFIIKRNDDISFVALQSPVAGELLKAYNLSVELLNTVVFLEYNKIYSKSEAVLRVIRKLRGLWRLGYIFIIVPKFIRDGVYDMVSANRFEWFGKSSYCEYHDNSLKNRFIE